MRPARSLALAAWVALLAACAGTGGVTSKGSAAGGATATGFHYSCGRWFGRPTAARVLADLRLTRPVTADDEAAVRRQGGEVVGRFHVPVLRVAVPTAAIPRLVDGDSIAEAVGVRDARRRDVSLRVRYAHPPTTEELARIRALGAAVAPSPEHVLAPDAAVPALLALPFVAAVAPDVPFCPGE